MKLPEKGEISYVDGKPACHICGKSFHRLMSHVRQKHNMTALEYKKKFGLNTGRGITSNESSQKSREAVYSNPDIIEALTENGKKTRFKLNSEGRTKDKVSLQELNRLKSESGRNTTEQQRELCRQLGKSGLGNVVRWGLK